MSVQYNEQIFINLCIKIIIGENIIFFNIFKIMPNIALVIIEESKTNISKMSSLLFKKLDINI